MAVAVLIVEGTWPACIDAAESAACLSASAEAMASCRFHNCSPPAS
jgi:hypothetical protein